jgi:hypothetical protein
MADDELLGLHERYLHERRSVCDSVPRFWGVAIAVETRLAATVTVGSSHGHLQNPLFFCSGTSLVLGPCRDTRCQISSFNGMRGHEGKERQILQRLATRDEFEITVNKVS